MRNSGIRREEDIVVFAEDRLNRATFDRFMANDPADHAPDWHEFGVLGHLIAVHRAAKIIAERTGVDVKVMALNHDIAKVVQFPEAICRRDSGEQMFNLAYQGHEARSADLASARRVSDADCLVIRHHDWAYLKDPSAYAIVNKFRGDRQTILRWMALCTCDAIGKGFTDKQKVQRPEIAERFIQVATVAGIDLGLSIVRVCCELAATEPIPQLETVGGSLQLA